MAPTTGRARPRVRGRFRVRLVGTGLTAGLAAGLLVACGSSADEADRPPAETASASPDAETLTTFAGRYLVALAEPDSASADQLSCDGASTLHGVVSAVEGGNWELGPVSVAGEGRGFAELRETVGDTALGMQAEFHDGEWCAVQ
ncbi:hypothetical protein RB608_13955 [Nocardioides sp. LHD-245]|uniref:hypothetical protein n=1 Tax=Nocardioides sp. LHD-245 TaxID=3051387 RepID=UPI0027E03D8B|nr:hypothetical protein [Nocardioides sp. LHD-245]